MQSQEVLDNSEKVPLSEYIRKTAEQLVNYSLEIQPEDRLLIKLYPACKELCDQVISLLRQKGTQFHIQIIDPEIEKIILESVSGGNFSLPATLQREKSFLQKH